MELAALYILTAACTTSIAFKEMWPHETKHATCFRVAYLYPKPQKLQDRHGIHYCPEHCMPYASNIGACEAKVDRLCFTCGFWLVQLQV